ncbi:MAG: riboflavin synthase [Synergistaceae bacterium]|jgi:riboflavin synthase|nr:riboflavin synthase [Synergistaceae bacterium]
MFTGLIECIGEVVSTSGVSDGVSEIAIRAPSIASKIAPGESIAVSGACLTAVGTDGTVFCAQMMEETLRVTRLGSLKPGGRVNLERALKAGDRFDGHIVLAHVDETSPVLRVEIYGKSRKIWISASKSISWGIAPKGSIAVDGVSLTVVDSTDEEFSVGLIPTTLKETTMGLARAGDTVNIEIDVIARYVARLSEKNLPNASSQCITWGKLSEYGW